MKFILACLMASIVLPVAAQAQTCFNGPQGQDRVQAEPIIGGGTTFNGPQGQDNGLQGQDRRQAQPIIVGHYTYYGSQGQVQGQRRCRQDQDSVR